VRLWCGRRVEGMSFVTRLVAARGSGERRVVRVSVLGRVVRMGVLAVHMVVYVNFMAMSMCVFDFACYEECG
jgi:hypothetical protein